MSGAPLWDHASTEALRQLYLVEGHPISTITKKMGRTDWSVRGKIRYEKWPSPKSNRESALRRGTAVRVNRIRQTGPVHVLPADTKLLKSKAWKPLPGSKPVSLVDLEPGKCKWPLGDDRPYLFCGAHAGDGPYCEHHRQISTRRPNA